jgi:hypothetical protein
VSFLYVTKGTEPLSLRANAKDSSFRAVQVTTQLTNPDPNAFFSYKTKSRQQTKNAIAFPNRKKETSTVSQNQKSAPGNLQAKLCTS